MSDCNHDKRFSGVFGCTNGCLACELEATQARLSAVEAERDTANRHRDEMADALAAYKEATDIVDKVGRQDELMREVREYSEHIVVLETRIAAVEAEWDEALRLINGDESTLIDAVKGLLLDHERRGEFLLESDAELEKLKEYAQHKWGCGALRPMSGSGVCDCGLPTDAAARDGVR